MNTPKNILVVISGKRRRHAALERALAFAKHNDIHIHLFNSIYEPVMELTDVLSSEHRKEMKREYLADRQLYMESVAKDITDQGIACTIHVTWHRDLEEAIETAATELAPDLVIKRITDDINTLNPFAMPIDRHLLRFCPAPLLLVKKSVWDNGPVLAAIDPTTSDSEHIQLNNKVIASAKMLAKLGNSSVHVVNTFETPTQVYPDGLPDFDYPQMRQATEDFHKDKMTTFLATHDIPKQNIHLLETSAETGINKLAEELEAQLVVLGTVGRSGISGAFFGNTVEKVLSHLTCEVFAIKPDKSKKS
ncbi:universal stress protein UspE [Aliiglaciecola sp. LCG003]|uniref:universal stress protein UspE n=1 Tax=Aliiglaciecola sp. LCG003 TaxID=3053655 RepID=UPI002573EEE5|nr:universal stress protein UspE [Aliiglaciecola sp. LCG003]WJG10781.1 universal stress protein UspE [Aliiglaciecola sp. LCG003]